MPDKEELNNEIKKLVKNKSLLHNEVSDLQKSVKALGEKKTVIENNIKNLQEKEGVLANECDDLDVEVVVSLDKQINELKTEIVELRKHRSELIKQYKTEANEQIQREQHELEQKKAECDQIRSELIDRSEVLSAQECEIVDSLSENVETRKKLEESIEKANLKYDEACQCKQDAVRAKKDYENLSKEVKDKEATLMLEIEGNVLKSKELTKKLQDVEGKRLAANMALDEMTLKWKEFEATEKKQQEKWQELEAREEELKGFSDGLKSYEKELKYERLRLTKLIAEKRLDERLVNADGR